MTNGLILQERNEQRNQPTNKQTCVITIAPDEGNNMECITGNHQT